MGAVEIAFVGSEVLGRRQHEDGADEEYPAYLLQVDVTGIHNCTTGKSLSVF